MAGNPFDRLLDNIVWQPLEPPPAAGWADCPYPVAEGYVVVGGASLRVFRFSDGTPVADPRGLDELGRWPDGTTGANLG